MDLEEPATTMQEVTQLSHLARQLQLVESDRTVQSEVLPYQAQDGRTHSVEAATLDQEVLVLEHLATALQVEEDSTVLVSDMLVQEAQPDPEEARTTVQEA